MKTATFKDRHGHTFGELLAIQEEQLKAWKPMLRPEVFTSLCQVIGATNCATNDSAHGLHKCPRGYEIATLILDYPKHQEILSQLATSALD